jgi:hypothetical protein
VKPRCASIFSYEDVLVTGVEGVKDLGKTFFGLYQPQPRGNNMKWSKSRQKSKGKESPRVEVC